MGAFLDCIAVGGGILGEARQVGGLRLNAADYLARG
jgi:hypothetical protein